MSTRLHVQFLILLPQREELIKTMPLVFKQNFGNKVAVIIDCFEVFTERPSSLIARAMTWSNYNTTIHLNSLLESPLKESYPLYQRHGQIVVQLCFSMAIPHI